MKNNLIALFICFTCAQLCRAQAKLHVVIVGLSHDHVNRMLEKSKAGEIVIEAIVEADLELANQKKATYHLADSLFYSNLGLALFTKPDLVMVYNAPSDHLEAIKACLSQRVPVMVEKPLCFLKADAEHIQQLSQQYNTPVFVNYPSAWYSSFNELVKRAQTLGPIHKMIMQGGHRGPVEIGCSKAFTNWLTDSIKNGGGALIDFGCYGASIMTELMNGQKPLSVYATARQLKPAIYKIVADDATIILEYPNATGIIEASWNWPYTMMNAELYTKDVHLHAGQFNETKEAPSLYQVSNNKVQNETIEALPYKDEVAYLTAVIKNNAPANIRLLSLEANLVVVQILDAARRSVKEGRKIKL